MSQTRDQQLFTISEVAADCCTISLPISCLRNDVLASRLLTEHTSANVIVLFYAPLIRLRRMAIYKFILID